MKELGCSAAGMGPFAEGLKGMFTEPVICQMACKYGKTPAQIILRWNVQQGVIVIPKSIHKRKRWKKIWISGILAWVRKIWQIAALDKGCPVHADTRKISEIRRGYDYLDNPVLTSL